MPGSRTTKNSPPLRLPLDFNASGLSIFRFSVVLRFYTFALRAADLPHFRALHPATLRSTGRTGKLRIACRRRFFVIEPLQHATLHFLTEDTFDVTHHDLVFTGYEREGISGLCSPAGAADPVRVRVSGIGHVIVDDMGYA